MEDAMFNLRPKKSVFFELYNESADAIAKCAQAFKYMIEHFETLDIKTKEISDYEVIGDYVTKKIQEEINKTFVTPFEREDMNKLALHLEHVLDLVRGTCERLQLYKVGVPKYYTKELVLAAVESCTLVSEAIILLENISKNEDDIRTKTHAIAKLESKGDHLFRQGLAKLFEVEKDPVELMKWKDIYEYLEELLDFNDAVGRFLEGIVLKYV